MGLLMKKVIWVVLIPVFIGFCAMFACSDRGLPPVGKPKTALELAEHLAYLPADTRVSLLFVLTAKQGSIHLDKEGHHILTFRKRDIADLVAFTDRPERLAFEVSVPMLAAFWHSGGRSFSRVPPNAVIEDTNLQTAVAELQDMAQSANLVQFKLRRDPFKNVDIDAMGKHLTNPALFIDASVFTAAGLSVLLQQGAKACVAVECYWALAGG